MAMDRKPWYRNQEMRKTIRRGVWAVAGALIFAGVLDTGQAGWGTVCFRLGLAVAVFGALL
jgi:hypothetical protein